MVGAAVVDPEGRVIMNTSSKAGNNWIHAERNAVGAYKARYGDLPKDCIIVVTLSPCSDEMHDREGISCSEFLNDLNTEYVYYGYSDPTQTNDTGRFIEIETKNSQIRDFCKSLADTFLHDHEHSLDEKAAAWSRKEGKNKTGGLNDKGVASYRKENPGSKLQKAVTTPPSKLKPGSKDAKRRKSFCARMGGMKGPMKNDKGEPTRKKLALDKWNCEE
jgi:pyrimidine deaminase RibD-like protein